VNVVGINGFHESQVIKNLEYALDVKVPTGTHQGNRIERLSSLVKGQVCLV
jgi:hypothetical protein